MRQWRVVIVTVLGCVLVAGTATAASELNQFVELTRGKAVAPTSPLPRTKRLDD